MVVCLRRPNVIVPCGAVDPGGRGLAVPRAGGWARPGAAWSDG